MIHHLGAGLGALLPGIALDLAQRILLGAKMCVRNV
jgi:hypothetical protein